jgi:hypothetical protein
MLKRLSLFDRVEGFFGMRSASLFVYPLYTHLFLQQVANMPRLSGDAAARAVGRSDRQQLVGWRLESHMAGIVGFFH